MSFFSIIIPLYNKEKFIESTLKSVFDQYFTDFEILIVNDGSTDLSEEKAKQFADPRIRYFLKENGGASSARNYGIEKAQSNYITFLDADDYWYPTFLQEMCEKINRFPKQKVFSAAIEIETSKKTIPAVYSIEKTNDFEIVNYFKSKGWEWGGDWKFSDSPHFQKTLGYSVRQLLALHQAGKVDEKGFVRI